jgi:hypothetical protein
MCVSGFRASGDEGLPEKETATGGGELVPVEIRLRGGQTGRQLAEDPSGLDDPRRQRARTGAGRPRTAPFAGTSGAKA